MPTVSKLDVEIGAKDRTKRAFAKVNRAMKTLKKGAFAAAAAVGAIGIGLVVAIKKAVNFADAIGKTADKVGITTAELQKLRFAFDIGGMAVEHTDKALTVFSRNIGDLRNNTGTLTTNLRKLGDHALNEVLMKTGKLTPKISALMQKMREMATQSDAVALGVAAFGRQGASLAAIARKGRMELEKWTKKAESLGIILSEKMVRGAEDLKDQMTILETKLKATFNQMILTFGPEIGLLVEDLTRLVFRLSQSAVELAKKWGLIGRNQKELGLAITQQAIAAARARHELDKIKEKQDAARRGFKQGFIGRIKAAEKEYHKEFQKLEVLLEQATAFETINRLKEKQNKLDNKNAAKTNKKKPREVLESLGQTQPGPLIDTDVLNAGTVSWQNLEQALFDADEALKTVKNTVTTSLTPIGEWKKSAQDMDAAMQQIAVNGADAMTESLMGMIRGTKSAKEAFSEFASSVIKDLQRMLIKKLIVDKVFGFVTQSLGLPQTKTTVTKEARFGGPVAGQKPVLVGEAGPEVFYPNSAGNIVANKNLGGAVVNQTINIQTGVSQTVRAEIMQLMPQINESTKAAILDARRRGGSFADGFA
jgi:hypothetical protein